jgi:DnaJ-class molecular chaperone
VAAKAWGRRKRSYGRHAIIESDPDNVDLSGKEHAWWADRKDVGGVPEGQQGSSRNKGQPREQPTRAKHSAFEGYFTAESLFRPDPDDPHRESDPYRILGLPETATWEQITAAHRRLAMAYHPDRQGEQASEQRAHSEKSIRDLNVAYTELRHRRGK